MSTPRTVNAPADIDNYPLCQIVLRNCCFEADHPQAPLPTGGGVIECAWSIEYEDDDVTEKHPAQAVSFSENAEGGWDKAIALRLG